MKSTKRLTALMGLSVLALTASLSCFAEGGERDHDEQDDQGCTCINGAGPTTDLSTGSAPWTSQTGAVSPIAPNGAWASGAPAQWISTGDTAQGKYKYELSIKVPKCKTPMKFKIVGQAWGDDLMLLKLDGNPLGNSSNAAVVINQVLGGTWPNQAYSAGSYGGFGQSNNLNINQSNLSPGTHMLKAIVDNAGGPTGFLFNGKLVAKCDPQNHH
jgi:hypothetical protein